MRLGVPVTVSGIVVMAAGLTPTPAGAQELQFRCDADLDGTVTAEQSQGCAERRFDLARGSADGLAEEQFAAALPDADGLRQQFGQVDRDGDGRISRDEWLAWFGPAYAQAMKAAKGQLNGTD
jgi:EF hand